MDLALLDRARELGARENGLAVAVTTRHDGSAQATVVNAGVLSHPMTAEPIVGFVARGHARKLVYLRIRPRVTVVFRAGWEWVTVEGDAELAGPDDIPRGMTSADLAHVLRDVYAAAVGGAADDWAAFDEVLAAERHTAVLIRPTRIYSDQSP